MSLYYKIKNFIISWVADIRVYAGGFIIFGKSYYRVKGYHQREIMNCIQPGDILLRRYNHYIGSVFISLISGTYWSHSAVYIGDYKDKPGRVIHMLSAGATNEDLLTFTRCDDVVVLRCDNKKYIEDAIIMAKYHYENETKYDYMFRFDNDASYCSEFVMDCYGEVEFYDRVSEKIIYPQDFLKSIFKVVWEKK